MKQTIKLTEKELNRMISESVQMAIKEDHDFNTPSGRKFPVRKNKEEDVNETLKLNESQLREMIDNAINEALQDEGLWNQFKQGTMAAFGKGDMGSKNYQNRQTRSGDGGWNLGKRWDAAKQNFKSQGVLDKNNEIINWLKEFMQNNGLTVSSKIGELWGKLDQQKAQATKRGSEAQNKIFK